MSRTLKALSWNIRANCGASDARLTSIADAIESTAADVVMLQEVACGTAKQLGTVLRARGFNSFQFSGGAGRQFRYGSALASRFPIRALSNRGLGSPWPQLFARAIVDCPAGSIEFLSAHMPNGSRYGWKKIEMFEALSGLLTSDNQTPRVIGGDFNEPRRFLRDGAVVSFGADEDGVVRGSWKGIANTRWQNAVENVLGPRSSVAHTWLCRNQGRPQTTHVNRGVTNCFFDHLLVSRDHFVVTSAGYHHHWRWGSRALSDHSAAWATIRRA